MVQVHRTGNNTTELHVNDTVVLYSYDSAVAYSNSKGFYIDGKKYSRTTSKHVSQFLNGYSATCLEHKEFEENVKKLFKKEIPVS